jgi:hypothetical protein
MRKKYQKGGFKYNKVGNTSITSKDIDKINKATGIQFTPEFSEAYFSTNTPPPTPPQKTDFSQIPIMDITMGGFGERRVWNIRPENLVGQEPQEGKHYYNVYPKQWDAYQKSPEYLNYVNKDRAGIASMQEGGEIEKYQPGGYKERGYDNPFIPKRITTVPAPPQYSYPAPTPSNPNQPFTGYGIPMPKTPWEASGVANKNYGRAVDSGGAVQPTTTTRPTTTPTPASTPQFQRPTVPTDASMEEIVTPENNNPSKYTTEQALKGEMLTDWGNNLAASNTTAPVTQTQAQEKQTTQPFQFNNYFNGISIPQAAGYLGESIANKNALGIVTSGTKLAAGLGRNILSGMGSQNRQNQIMRDYVDEQRDVLTQANRPAQLRDQGYGEDMGYYQEGGKAGVGQEEMIMQVAQALQQGADPQEVLQQLLQMGLEESEAIQLIEGIMQQMQQESPQQEQPIMQNGGEYLNQIKGKRIVDYKFNPETGNYDIEYED